MKEERRKKKVLVLDLDLRVPPGFTPPPPQKDVLRVIRDLLISTYSGVSV